VAQIPAPPLNGPFNRNVYDHQRKIIAIRKLHRSSYHSILTSFAAKPGILLRSLIEEILGCRAFPNNLPGQKIMPAEAVASAIFSHGAIGSSKHTNTEARNDPEAKRVPSIHSCTDSAPIFVQPGRKFHWTGVTLYGNRQTGTVLQHPLEGHSNFE